MHHMKRYKYYGEWKSYVVLYARSENITLDQPFKKAKVSIIFHFTDNRRHDVVDNYPAGCKGLYDGLIKAGIIKDDSWQNLKAEYRGKKGNVAKTEVVIKELSRI